MAEDLGDIKSFSSTHLTSRQTSTEYPCLKGAHGQVGNLHKQLQYKQMRAIILVLLETMGAPMREDSETKNIFLADNWVKFKSWVRH